MSDMRALIEAAHKPADASVSVPPSTLIVASARYDRLIGDDLSDADLVEFWRYFHGEENDMSRWWSDKPHQIAWRLLMRLVRAEAALHANKETP